MKKEILLPIILFSAFLLSGCRTDWGITDSGLGGDTPVSSTRSSGSEVGDLLDSYEAGTTYQYNPDAIPPDIDLPSVWKQFTNAAIQNNPGYRSADAYLAVIKQFNVDSNPCRYTFGCENAEYTRCNIYASDVMNAMGAHLPTKGELGVGQGSSKNSDPMPANAEHTHAWLEEEQGGWRKLNPANPTDWEVLLDHVTAGKPALASHPDHIAVIRPDQPGGLAAGDINGLHIAQSGAYNSSDTQLGAAFGRRNVDIYIHD